MEERSMWEQLQEIKRFQDEFLQQWEDKILEMLVKDRVSAEESLCQEIMSELLDKIQRVSKLIGDISRTHLKVGYLSQRKDGSILFCGEILLPLQELEVYIYDDGKEMMVWTRTFVSITGKGERPYLVGLGENFKIDGIQARIRQ